MPRKNNNVSKRIKGSVAYSALESTHNFIAVSVSFNVHATSYGTAHTCIEKREHEHLTMTKSELDH